MNSDERGGQSNMICEENMQSDVRLEQSESDAVQTKLCTYCGLQKPLTEFKKRTGKRRGGTSRRGACKDCRKKRPEQPVAAVTKSTESTAAAKKPLVKKQVPIQELMAIGLVPNRNGFIRMRGKTDNGRKWHQEIDPELALTLVKERAAVVVNRHTIRRLYSNKEFRQFVLERDQYTCHFCGQYGDTIDHMLPRAKGGHTTPDNCVCACNLCNQSKADRDMDEFIMPR